ncbi:unnamed protein product [Closterium sp. NIES-64]|nr:unnamed protein product [Closterium sp. NIES-64]
MTSRRVEMRRCPTFPLCLLILCVASTCRACLPPLFTGAADSTPPNPNPDWPSEEEKIGMARIAVAQHNAAKNGSLQPISLVRVERAGD